MSQQTSMQTTDPRPLYASALSWVADLVENAGGLDRPTPCTEYDVRALLGHIVATVDRIRVAGEGGDVAAEPVVVAGVPDDGWPAAFATATERMRAVWADDALLDRPTTVPWGTLPGRATIWGYLNEALVHGWDLAVATGQDAEADPVLVAAALEAVQRFLPADVRGGEVPFDPIVEPGPGARPTERLANWSGHRRG